MSILSRDLVVEFLNKHNPELVCLFDKYIEDKKVVVSGEIKKVVKKGRKTEVLTSEKNKNTCTYIFSKGSHAGSKCTIALQTEECITSGLCKKHINSKSQKNKLSPESSDQVENKKTKGSKTKGLQTKISDHKTNRSKEVFPDTTECKTLINTEVSTPKVFQKIEKPALIIKRNIFGNFEHLDSGLVFNKDRKVVGRQVESNVEPLTEDDKVECEKYGFSYQ